MVWNELKLIYKYSKSDSSRMKKVAAPKPPPSFQSSNGTREMMTAHHLSDDCAINELLEGRMELDVILPDNRKVRMSVERRTPMMDLLVQATTANKINPGGHVIHMWKGKGHDFVHYKPNTPIGSLDTNTIYIVPKSSVIDPPTKRMSKTVKQPFEQTFRLQVNLPRNQLMVLRVSPKTQLREVKQMACTEKHLDPSKYQLVHPNRPSQILDLSTQLIDYGSTEITLMSISNIEANIYNSATDLIAFSTREEDKKKKGILSIFSKKKNKGSFGGSSSDSVNKGISPYNTLENASKSGLKKRPAPLPPQTKLVNSRIESVSHSRHSSDSSGYHESSVFSDSPETSSGSGLSSLDSTDNHVNGKLSNGITKMVIQTQCTAPKKRKAPPPPVLSAETQNKENFKNISDDNSKESKCPVIDASPEYEEDEVIFSATDARRMSLSSLGTIDDIENSFEQTIAEAQRVIDLEEEMKKNTEVKEFEEKVKSVTKTEVVTLHARLEQDINKQQIHSEINTAFNALQLQKDMKKNACYDIDRKEEEQNQNEKQTDDKTTLQVLPMPCRKLASSDESSDEVFERCNHVIRKKSRSKTKRKQKPAQQITDNTKDDSKKLENFSIGSYTSNENYLVPCEQITERKTEHGSLQRSSERKCITKSESFNVSREEWIKIRPKKGGYGGPGVRIRSFLERSDKKKPNDNKVYGLEGSVRGIKGQVRLRCAEITDMGFSPALKEKSRSMLNLIPENNINVETEIPLDTKEENSNNSSLLKRALSEHNLSGADLMINEESKSEFAKEQERLQQEYRKLQKQFVVWQKQLMSNHTLLEKECLFPKKCVIQEDKPTKSNHFKPVVKVRESKSLTRNTKSELLNNVTLSTWDSNRLTDYSSLPNKSSIRQSFSEKRNEKIDINSSDLKIKTKNLSSNGLRSSSNKTYFKPPAVRSSSSTRQRLPPEVRTEDEEKNISINKIENRKERISRRDSFEKFENSKMTIQNQPPENISVDNRKNGTVKSTNVKNIKSTLEISKVSEKSTNKTPIKGSVPMYTYFGGPLHKNNYNSQIHNYDDSWSKKENQQKLQTNTNTKEQNVIHCLVTVPPPPPPPPPPPQLPLPTDVNKQTSVCQTVEKKPRTSVSNHSVDPRDKLMIEVRNFGGRKGLRKISNPEPAWQLNVFGPQFTSKA
ncbi:actin cytoskeleton-regulatory complex protein PAN1-like isoform X2 [Centruroides sculpturatus]|uniref:actin cytoskeleton-regulatory complex protein PAN1-like isoform X2 n=1 Tax=Centruroides sculpturatus TaxID=218467 RepID=UPI000C6D1B12|nr:actin cytoskeleton-regulatory complex protein PAN1-like isoform X2 [Centruroides sculpturatus]